MQVATLWLAVVLFIGDGPVGLTSTEREIYRLAGLGYSREAAKIARSAGSPLAKSILARLTFADLPDAREAGITTFNPADARKLAAEAIPELQNRSETVAAYAYSLGRHYELGIGVEKDEAQAVKYYRSAADRGDVNALKRLVICYIQGIAGTDDPMEALAWGKKASKTGDPLGHEALGLIYDAGKGFPENLGLAASLYEKAAQAGSLNSMRACYNVAMKRARNSMDKNDFKSMSKYYSIAEKWRRQGAEAGDLKLARILADSLRFESDGKELGEAFRWAKRAGETGMYQDLLVLAGFYLEGKGCPSDPGQAEKILKQLIEEEKKKGEEKHVEALSGILAKSDTLFRATAVALLLEWEENKSQPKLLEGLWELEQSSKSWPNSATMSFRRGIAAHHYGLTP